jgi:uncharacterized protein YqeY
MEIKEQVQEDIKTAMREKDADKLIAVRAVKAAIDKFEKENPGSAINYVSALKPLVKQRTDSIEQFKSAGMDDLAKKESVELSIINTYLVGVQPKQMSEADMATAVKKLAEENSYTTADMGKVMSYFKSNYADQYDGKVLSTIVRTVLS